MANEMNDEIESKEEVEGLLASLEQCRETTMDGLMHCLSEGGDFVKPEHIRWLLDCSEICTISANFLIRDSEYAGDILNICSYICDDCAESCEVYFNDEHMKHCAQACRNCAQACREGIMTEDEIEEAEESAEEE